MEAERITQTAPGQPKPANAWLVLFALVALLGLVCWGLQLSRGLQLTNLNDKNMWGLYIVGFMVFTGVAAGSLFFGSLPYLFNLGEFKPFTRIAAYLAAVASIVAASLFIIVDIGNPERIWFFITSGNFASPMFWDSVILLFYMVVSVIFTRQLILVREGKKPEQEIKAIAVLAFVAGILVTATSFVFGFQPARPLWHNPVQPVSFLVAALIAALAVLVILAAILQKRGFLNMPAALLGRMGKLAAALLLVELIIVAGEVFTGLYPGAGPEYEAMKWLVAGKGAPAFWLEIIVLIGAMAILGSQGAKENRTGLVTGALVAFVGICLVKANLLQAELFNPVLSYPGLALMDQITGPYIPSLVEIGLSLGIVSLGCLLFALGLRKLNLVG
ncbi:MAG TPA: polysulfide reductase NrfD [Clostridia bacterium]|nr:polysulfide reductase NrfD [Clostridia bacterium]